MRKPAEGLVNELSENLAATRAMIIRHFCVVEEGVDGIERCNGALLWCVADRLLRLGCVVVLFGNTFRSPVDDHFHARDPGE